MDTHVDQGMTAQPGADPRAEPSSARDGPAPARVHAWLARIARGDEAAMAELYRAFARRVYAYALNHLHDPGVAEEVAVDTLFEVWRRPDAWRGESRFSTWLIGIARHKSIDALRARAAPVEDLDDHVETLRDPAPDAYDRLCDARRRADVSDCVARLPRHQRDAIHLVLYQGMTLAEVARVQGIPENTAKTRVFHARRRIERCLRERRVAAGDD
jgi:RNA polymerase sigma-70 factor, ECF subfamily